MPVTVVPNYYSLKLTHNSKDGAITERYALSPSLTFPVNVMRAAMIIATWRGYLLAAGSAEVEGVISNEVFASNLADGIKISTYNLQSPILLKKVDNTTSETAIESYGQANQGIRIELPTINGRVENRLLRFCRQSWIQQNQVMIVGAAPYDIATYEAFIGTSFALATPAKALSAFVSYIRDKTVMARRVATGFELAPFASGGPDWSISGVGTRNVGFGWPRTLGRQRNYS